ncbi:hypothetical protein [Bifidobacterium samirii]|uniref:Oligoribonuclease (3'->5' exoribonuclease) n=1 Tax=Bifidobacterium samirii TaxID=2306974 RepID=A0A430FUJ6_9BIFI|nr:hypothetical protein [Bifidobacterium samirii]RSX56752.1 Oligoribonuclease (3'->5' exoribonuclease) [Bifidobacterium samirii]
MDNQTIDIPTLGSATDRPREAMPPSTPVPADGLPLDPPTPPEPRHLLLWVDVETDDIDPDECAILELGLRVTDLTGFDMLDSLRETLHQDRLDLNPGTLTAVRMHVANGLLGESLNGGVEARYVGAMAAKIIDCALALGVLHPAGTNPQFDLTCLRRILRAGIGEDMTSKLMARLSYRRVDMTCMRLASQAAGGDPWAGSAGAHRVEDCLDRDIRQWQRLWPLLEGFDWTGEAE